MSTVEIILFGVGCLMIGAGITNEIWRRVFDRHINWWREHADKIESQTGGSIKRLCEIAESSLHLNDKYRGMMAGKILIKDPMLQPGRKGKA